VEGRTSRKFERTIDDLAAITVRKKLEREEHSIVSDVPGENLAQKEKILSRTSLFLERKKPGKDKW